MEFEAEKAKAEFKHCSFLVLARSIKVRERVEMNLKLIQIDKGKVQDQPPHFFLMKKIRKSQAQCIKSVISLFRR